MADTDNPSKHEIGVQEDLVERQKSAMFLAGQGSAGQARHAALVKIVTRHPHNPAKIMGAITEYMRHGPPEFIRIADAVDNAVRNEVELMAHQKANGIKI